MASQDRRQWYYAGFGQYHLRWKRVPASEINVFGAEDDDPRVSGLAIRARKMELGAANRIIRHHWRSVSVKAAESKGAAQ